MTAEAAEAAERRQTSRSLRRRLLSAFLAAIAGCLTAPHHAAAADAAEVRVAVPLPATHPVVSGGWQAFQEAAADGQADLKFRLFVNGAMIGWERTLKGLSQGEADMGFLAPADYPDEFPHAAFLTALSMSGRDGLAAAAAVTELVLLHCQPCRDEFARKNLVFLGTYSAAPYLLISKEPLSGARSLADRTVWTPGTLWDNWVREMGATPLQDGRDAGEALSKGGADVVIDVAIALRQPQLAKQVRYVTALPLGAYRGASPFTANRDFWRQLSVAQRTALLAAAPAGMAAATVAYEEQAEEAIATAQETGITLAAPGAGLLERADRFAEESAARIAANAEAYFGVGDAGRLLQAYRALYTKYSGLLEAAEDAPAMAAILAREAFAKVNPVAYGVEDASIAEDAGPASATEVPR